MENTHYVYLLQEREFINSGEKIYKVGKKEQKNNKRFNSYPKNSILLYQTICDNCHELEKKILNIFPLKYKQCKNIGNEYFEGDCEDMIKNIFYIRNDMISDKEIISKDVEIEKNKLININNGKQKQKLMSIEENERNKIFKYIENVMDNDIKKILFAEKQEMEQIKKNEEIDLENMYISFLNDNLIKTNDNNFDKRCMDKFSII